MGVSLDGGGLAFGRLPTLCRRGGQSCDRRAVFSMRSSHRYTARIRRQLPLALAIAAIGVAVATAHVIANATAILHQVPGGLGAIEGSMPFLLPDANLIADVLLFRIVYYLLLLRLGLMVFSLSELILALGAGRAR